MFVEKLSDRNIQEIAQKLHMHYAENYINNPQYKYYNFSAHKKCRNIIQIIVDCPKDYTYYYQIHIKDFCTTLIFPADNGDKIIIDEDITKKYTDYMSKQFDGYSDALKVHKAQVSELVK